MIGLAARIRAPLTAALLAGCAERPEPAAPMVAAAILVRPEAVTLEPGGSAQLAAQVNDAVGAPIGGAAIGFQSDDPSVARVTERGLVIASGAAGRTRVRVSAGGRSASVGVTVVPGPASGLEPARGDGQEAVVAHAVAERLEVKVVDAHGNAVPGATVRFSTADGTLAPAVTVSDGSGLAASVWTLGPRAGLQRASASLQGSAAGVAFSANAAPDRPASLALAAEPPHPAAGAALDLAVRAADPLGNPCPGVEVTFVVGSGGGSITPSKATTDGGGNALARLVTGTTVGRNEVTATAAGLAGAPGPTLRVEVDSVAGPAARIEGVEGDRKWARSGLAVRVRQRVRVTDAHGNPVGAVPVRCTVVEGGGAVEGGEPVLTDAAGEATCGRWTLGTPGRNRLEAAAAGVAAPVIFQATARPR
jgi:hypothetical protein